MDQRLPFEIIQAIIEAGVPSNPRTILPPARSITKTLLSWTLVCRATTSLASRLLRHHCIHIDSSQRLRALVEALRRQAPRTSGPGAVTQMYLAPFPDVDYQLDTSPLDDIPTAQDVHDLFTMVAPTLRRLIVDMPLRSLYPEDDPRKVRCLLRAGFAALVNVEELVSISDELFLNVRDSLLVEPEIWATCWPRLRLLSLYNVDLYPNMGFMQRVASVPHLESVVLPRPDGLDGLRYSSVDEIEYSAPPFAIDIKKLWLDALAAAQNMDGTPKHRTEDFTVTFVDVRERTPNFRLHEMSWKESDPEGRICVKICKVPRSRMDDDIGMVQRFMTRHALDGTLFDARLGERVDLGGYRYRY